jgi:hypothetical protein
VKGQLDDKQKGPVGVELLRGSLSTSQPFICSRIALSIAACCTRHTTTRAPVVLPQIRHNYM